MSNNRFNLVFIISGPSGAGKSTLIHRVMKENPDLAFSVSHTTRPPRPGEVDGKDYYFVTHEAFQKLIKENAFLEWAEVYGELYGTSKREIERLHNLGKDVVLDIDVQGARQVMNKLERDRWVSIFILPPDLDTLKHRLVSRGKDPLERIEHRLEVAKGEIIQASNYDYQITNDDLDRATVQLETIIETEREKHSAR